MNLDIIDKFTTHLKNALTRALNLAKETQEPTILPLHLLWALATQKGSIGAEIIRKAKIPEAAILALFADRTAKLPLDKTNRANQTRREIRPKLGAEAKAVIEKAVLAANLYEHKYVGTEHLLAGLAQIDDQALKNFLQQHEINPKDLREQVSLVLKSTSKFPELAASLGFADQSEFDLPRHLLKEKKKKKQAPKTPALDFFALDLTNPENQKKIDPVIGREEEIERIMQILCRRTKNNPILLGDPGVGKTAIVEGLAKKIAAGEVPGGLQGKRILALDLSLIVAGTMYRGEFEGRFKQIIDEVKANPEIILFIDEVHTIIGAGSASGSLDAANILKPALSRGEIRCLGATTLAEYKKHLESDAALERRFQPVLINEPSAEKTKQILSGLKKNYETFHDVLITPEAINRAVELADRYLQEKFFPDKAIDLIDEAASSIRVRQKSSNLQKKIRALEEERERLREEKRLAVTEERFIEAISLKEQERACAEKLGKLTTRPRSRGKNQTRGRITGQHIAEVVSRMTGVPTASLLENERERLLNLEEILQKRILGQGEVIRQVAEFVRRAKTGLARPERPLASFLFIGPSGVGKTELAKLLAATVFEDQDALIRLDMSEFSEGFTISKLIGAPAGYVGYKESAKLTDAVKHKPYSLILFDELEKAHPDVLNLLLQILDEGHLTDATGRKINFKNTILILTSNIGSEKFRGQGIGFLPDPAAAFGDLAADLQAALRDRFRPEFLNRIDRVCVFQPLEPATLEKIVDLELWELNQRLANQNLVLTLEPAARQWIVEHGTNQEHGARAIRRVIQDALESQIATLLLESPPSEFRRIKVVLEKDQPILI